MDTADIIKFAVTIISVFVAVWQIKARLNIQKMLQQESFISIEVFLLSYLTFKSQ